MQSYIIVSNDLEVYNMQPSNAQCGYEKLGYSHYIHKVA